MNEPVQTVTDPQAAQLESLLREIGACYEALARCAIDRREAMRRADTQGLARCVQEENRQVQAIAELERRRMIVVEALAARFGAPEKSQTPVSRLAPLLPEPSRSRLLTLAQGLRELMERVTALNDSTRRAAETLASHMEGLLRHVASKLNHAQVYGPRGVVAPGARVVSAIDSVG